MADSSSIAFIAALIAIFFILKWLLNTTESRRNNSNSSANANNNNSSQRQRQQVRDLPIRQRDYRRTVDNSMIEVVQAMAPNLTVEQIRFDLERTGSVETTVDRYLAQGDLPFPPNSSGQSNNNASNNNNSNSGNTSGAAKRSSTGKQGSLVSRYGVPENEDEAREILGKKPVEKPKWSQSKEERQQQLKRQQQEMVLKARQRFKEKEQEKKEA